LCSTPIAGDGVRDFSDASPPTDIDSSGDDVDVLASLSDVSDRRDDSVAGLTLCGFAVTPILETLTVDLGDRSSAAAASSSSSWGPPSLGPDPDPVGAFRTETSTSCDFFFDLRFEAAAGTFRWTFSWHSCSSRSMAAPRQSAYLVSHASSRRL
jgi:hypothetical protein